MCRACNDNKKQTCTRRAKWTQGLLFYCLSDTGNGMSYVNSLTQLTLNSDLALWQCPKILTFKTGLEGFRATVILNAPYFFYFFCCITKACRMTFCVKISDWHFLLVGKLTHYGHATLTRTTDWHNTIWLNSCIVQSSCHTKWRHCFLQYVAVPFCRNSHILHTGRIEQMVRME